MLVAGVAATVLADIGGRTLAAQHGRGAVIERERAGLRAGAVIVEEADRVGQAPVVEVVPIMAGVRQVRGQDRDGEEGRGNAKLRFGHFDSPEVLLNDRAFAPRGCPLARRKHVKTTR